MRRLRVKSVLSSPQHEALLFFALSLDEQLFDMTDDSFKAPAEHVLTNSGTAGGCERKPCSRDLQGRNRSIC
jgi:hypothetical protein